jgi:hypothetical protein
VKVLNEALPDLIAAVFNRRKGEVQSGLDAAGQTLRKELVESLSADVWRAVERMQPLLKQAGI